MFKATLYSDSWVGKAVNNNRRRTKDWVRLRFEGAGFFKALQAVENKRVKVTVARNRR